MTQSQTSGRRGYTPPQSGRAAVFRFVITGVLLALLLSLLVAWGMSSVVRLPRSTAALAGSLVIGEAMARPQDSAPGDASRTEPSAWPGSGGIMHAEAAPASEAQAAITADADAALAPVAAIPAEFLLAGVPVGKQTRPLNCEFQTASDLAWYYGKPHTWSEIFFLVGHDVGGNPHKGFVGRSFDDPPGRLYPNGYGVYAEPMAAAFAAMGLVAEVHYGRPADWIRQQVAQGRPVMIWATANMVVRPVETWTAADGVVVKAVRGEHTFLVIGYDSDGVWVTDPWDGRRHFYTWSAFLASWDLLDRMSLIVTGPQEE